MSLTSNAAHRAPPFRIATTHLRLDHPGVWAAHHHGCHELLWGTEGTLSVETDDGLFVAPATLGLWIPAGVVHAVRSSSHTGFYCTYLTAPAGAATALDPQLTLGTRAVDVSPLMREILLHLRDAPTGPSVRRAAEDLFLGLVAPVAAHDISLPMPSDERLVAICQRLLDDPADSRSLGDWGRAVGGSARNLSRLFVREAGMTFEQWRIQARIRVAIALLTAGTPVGSVARAVGYTTASSFVQSFRRVLGHTPGRYLRSTGAPRSGPALPAGPGTAGGQHHRPADNASNHRREPAAHSP
ncbi:helix-turn-helix domain-containing protein [Streptomyces profundus]|uniref:helix-turn-helix domain-containing protein n=1 Tax=Streptomyces profundus TaxID=2867410 RepID=UPI001D1629B7|nr:AraC family transcriptional regulator [Streptomyces sp. MA3_2.13]UED83888.1 AraC family transcriptional regulator [Streptomyces sp. MA3_2.13]